QRQPDRTGAGDEHFGIGCTLGQRCSPLLIGARASRPLTIMMRAGRPRSEEHERPADAMEHRPGILRAAKSSLRHLVGKAAGCQLPWLALFQWIGLARSMHDPSVGASARSET